MSPDGRAVEEPPVQLPDQGCQPAEDWAMIGRVALTRLRYELGRGATEILVSQIVRMRNVRFRETIAALNKTFADSHHLGAARRQDVLKVPDYHSEVAAWHVPFDSLKGLSSSLHASTQPAQLDTDVETLLSTKAAESFCRSYTKAHGA